MQETKYAGSLWGKLYEICNILGRKWDGSVIFWEACYRNSVGDWELYSTVSQPSVRGPVLGPRLILKEFTGPRSSRGWEPLLYGTDSGTWRMVIYTLIGTQSLCSVTRVLMKEITRLAEFWRYGTFCISVFHGNTCTFSPCVYYRN
jgi:hypothetical protein